MNKDCNKETESGRPQVIKRKPPQNRLPSGVVIQSQKVIAPNPGYHLFLTSVDHNLMPYLAMRSSIIPSGMKRNRVSVMVLSMR